MSYQVNRHRYSRFVLSFFIFAALIIFHTKSYAVPFSIVPSGTLPTSVVSGSTVAAAYSVRNNTASQRNGNVVKYLPPNVEVDNATGCGSSFNLAAKGESGDTCTLNLIISGAVNANDPNPNNHLFVCFPGGKTCAGTNFPLNVKEISVTNSSRVTVGTYATIGNFLSPLSYFSTDAGTTWTASIPPKIGNLSDRSELTSVNCGRGGTSILNCTAVGYYTASGTDISQPVSYISSDGGITWSASVPVPQGDTSETSILSGVSCQGTSNQYCVSVGTYFPLGLNKLSPLVYYSTNNGTNWIPSFPTLQGDATSLNNISCNGSTALYCTAVGDYIKPFTTVDVPITYFTTTGGITWTAVFPAQQGDLNNNSTLSGVSCTGTTGENCVAVGSYTTLTGNIAPISYTSTNSGSSWTVSIPTQQGDTTEESELIGVSCVNANCLAVGYYTTLTGNVAPLAYVSTNGGTTWTATFPPEQGGVLVLNQLAGVSCSGPTGQSCTAVGFYLPSGESVVAPISYLTEDGGSTWTVSIPPKQAPTSLNSFLVSVN